MSNEEITKEKFEKVYKRPGLTGREAAKELGITVKMFNLKFKEFGMEIKKRTSNYPLLADKDKLRYLYLVDKKSVRNIAVEAGASIGATESALRWAGVTMRTVKEGVELAFPGGRHGPSHPSWKGGRKIANTNGGVKSEKIKESLARAFPDGRAGDKAPMWGGGRYMAGRNQAYVYIWSPQHEGATKQGYVMEHRLVMEKKVGRPLTKSEIVHHINGVKSDNRPENLVVASSRGEHTRQHFENSFRTQELEIENARLKKLLSDNNITL